jgi:PAS domain S-box-containing protein
MRNQAAQDPTGLDPAVREVLDAAPMLVWISGPDMLCTWFNRPWLDFTGRTMPQELGNGWAEGVHPDDLNRCLGIYTSHFHQQRPFRMQYRLRADDGTYRWIDDTGIARYDTDGVFLGYIGACVDVHEIREAEAQLRVLQEELQIRPLLQPAGFDVGVTALHRMGVRFGQPHDPIEDLVAGIAHELTAIVTIALGNLEIAQRHLDTGGGREERLQRAVSAALQAARRAPVLIQRLLAFSQRRRDSA